MSVRRGLESLLKSPEPPTELLVSLRVLEAQTVSLQAAIADLARELHALREREERRSSA